MSPRATALSGSNEWKTPGRIFRPLNRRYRYTLDVAAARWNHQLTRFYTRSENALVLPWPGRPWCNPPYSRGNLPVWVPRARDQVLAGVAELCSCLVPHSTSDGWWHEAVEAPAGRFLRAEAPVFTSLGVERTVWWRELGVRVLTLRGRLDYEHRSGVTAGETARHHSVVVTFLRRGCRL